MCLSVVLADLKRNKQTTDDDIYRHENTAAQERRQLTPVFAPLRKIIIPRSDLMILATLLTSRLEKPKQKHNSIILC